MQYSLRIPDDDELMPEFSLWMYDSPRENLELDIWRQSWLIWKKHITKIYELSVIEFVFTRWGIYQKNENTRLFKKRFFPTGMTMITKSSRYGIIVKIKYDGYTVFACYVLHYIETQRILWLNYMVHTNLHKIHTDKINHLSIYVRNTDKRTNHDTVVNVQPVSPRSNSSGSKATYRVSSEEAESPLPRVYQDVGQRDEVLTQPTSTATKSSEKFDSQHINSSNISNNQKPYKHCDTPRSNWFC
jgi:hypothetical protein